MPFNGFDSFTKELGISEESDPDPKKMDRSLDSDFSEWADQDPEKKDRISNTDSFLSLKYVLYAL